MSPFGFGLDWRKSPAHLLLLTKFLRPRAPEEFPPDCWQAVLRETPRKAIKRYWRKGLLEEPSLAEYLDYSCRPSELRKMAHQRGLGTEGAKSELIERLIDADAAGMKAAVRDVRLLHCTDRGRAIASQFLAQRAETRAKLADTVLTALLRGRLREATQRVAAFEAGQTLPRTVGPRWQNYNTAADYAVLKAIFQGRPGILTGLSSGQVECLQLAAAMMHLCGSEECQAWLPPGFETPLRIDNDAAARMILYSAYHRCKAASFLAAGVETVGIQARPNPCPACATIAQQAYPLSGVPELPYDGCSHELGCRCIMVEA
jgi:hypothetical protein